MQKKLEVTLLAALLLIFQVGYSMEQEKSAKNSNPSIGENRWIRRAKTIACNVLPYAEMGIKVKDYLFRPTLYNNYSYTDMMKYAPNRPFTRIAGEALDNVGINPNSINFHDAPTLLGLDMATDGKTVILGGLASQYTEQEASDALHHELIHIKKRHPLWGNFIAPLAIPLLIEGGCYLVEKGAQKLESKFPNYPEIFKIRHIFLNNPFLKRALSLTLFFAVRRYHEKDADWGAFITQGTVEGLISLLNDMQQQDEPSRLWSSANLLGLLIGRPFVPHTHPSVIDRLTYLKEWQSTLK